MTFQIYDKLFTLLETISHDERSATDMIYEEQTHQIIIATATGVSIWSCCRSASLDLKSHIFERNAMISIGWVSFITLDSLSSTILTVVGRSAVIISLHSKKIIARLDDIHEDSLTRIQWFAKNHFYVTGCKRGLVRVWTSHFQRSNRVAKQRDILTLSDENTRTSFALVHSFSSHVSAITGLALHSSSHLFISSSLDGVIKVFNVELLCEVCPVL